MVKYLVALLACSGCSLITESFATNDFSGDQYPIHVDTRSGAVLLGLESGGIRHTAVIDVLSPLTLIDPGASVEATIDTEDLTLIGDRAGVVGMPEIPRAYLAGKQVLRLHPCAITTQMCELGAPGSEQPFDAIVGSDSLAGDALRMRLGDNQVFVLANIGGSDEDRTFACDAVFKSPYRGGGTLVVAGTEVPFAGRRVTVQACLGADPDPLISQDKRGTDALFVMSTSIGHSLMAESAYERYRQPRMTVPPLSTLPDLTLSLPSGPVAGKLAIVDRMALVARASTEPLAPCRQFYAHHLLVERNCLGNNVEDCPCEDGDKFCPVPASVDIRTAIEILIVPDDNPTLQALRTEFRPTLQEIDGLLGTGAMKGLELDIDYPHNRFLARCATLDSATCTTRPALGSQDDRRRIRGCPHIEAEISARVR
ncbi:MAG: hypothetical protein M4D80_03750 [Myxococcota bacterium]|nr:hypothetical protein [Myxococcota bacterium]